MREGFSHRNSRTPVQNSVPGGTRKIIMRSYLNIIIYFKKHSTDKKRLLVKKNTTNAS
jgi:hypothetical protein